MADYYMNVWTSYQNGLDTLYKECEETKTEATHLWQKGFISNAVWSGILYNADKEYEEKVKELEKAFDELIESEE